MHRSQAMRVAEEAAEACRQAAAAVSDPDAIPANEALRLYVRLDQAERVLAGAKVLLASRVAASREWERLGHRGPAEHLAQIAGSSIGAAKRELETSDALESLASTKRALLDGELSSTQSQVVVAAARVNPAAEASLLEQAGTASARELRQAAQRARAAGDPNPEATEARIRRERRAAHEVDAEGAFTLSARGTVADGSVVAAELERLTDKIFRQQARARSYECRSAYSFDALVEMARRSSQSDPRATSDNEDATDCGSSGRARRRLAPPEHLALLRLDIEALWRGHVKGEELCEVTGLGPIPVATARRLLGGAVLKLVITKGEAVAHVTSLTRGPTQAMRYALLWTSPTCDVAGCTRTFVEHDHRIGAEYRDTRHTRLDEIDRVCSGHHDLHTRHGWALVPGTGKRPMVPPDDPRHPLFRPRAGPDGESDALAPTLFGANAP